MALALMLAGCDSSREGKEEATTEAAPAAAPQSSEAAAPPFSAPATAAPRIPGHGQAERGHLKMTGAYVFDVDVHAFCASLPRNVDQITLFGQGSPRVILQIRDLQASGEYDAQLQVVVVNTGEFSSQSSGKARTEIELVRTSDARPGQYLSGSFSGTFQGNGGKGAVEGSFAHCFKEDPPKVAGTIPPS